VQEILQFAGESWIRKKRVEIFYYKMFIVAILAKNQLYGTHTQITTSCQRTHSTKSSLLVAYKW